VASAFASLAAPRGLKLLHSFCEPGPARAHPQPAQSREGHRAALCAMRRLAALLRSRLFASGGAPGAVSANYRSYETALEPCRRSRPRYPKHDYGHARALCWAVEDARRPETR
jgi:hypothetical protein